MKKTDGRIQKTVSERSIALSIVLRVLDEGAFLDAALGDAFDKSKGLSDTQRAFITRLCTVVIERQRALDFLIDENASVPVRKQKKRVRNVLRLGAAQLFFMDQVSDAAAVSRSVALLDGAFSSLKPFANGVLRNLARRREALMERLAAQPAAVRLSVPDEIWQMWEACLSPEALLRIARSLEAPAALCVRAVKTNGTPEALEESLTEEGAKLLPVEGLDAFYLLSGGRPDTFSAWKRGFMYVQDPAAIRCALALPVREGMRVLDVCAAPGGKALLTAERLAPLSGTVTARDRTAEKVQKIRDNAVRLGLSNLTPEIFDATEEDTVSKAGWDAVICDLPCSGLGVLSRKPDIRCRASLEQIKELAALQARILELAASYVAPEGFLLYSTCTISPRENEEQTSSFLRRHADFVCEREELLLPGAGRSDGAYYCLMQRRA